MTDQLLLDDFRLAMRRHAATTTILTVMRGGTPQGMVATAVCSLSVDPPTMLCCINKSASLHDAFIQAGHFGINILAVDQIEVAQRFCDPSLRDTRFVGVPWWIAPGDVPLLDGSQASLACRSVRHIEHASHTILVGEVVRAQVRDAIVPLLYADGRYSAQAAIAE